MRIVVDRQIFALQEYGGISRYFCSLSESLSQVHGVDIRIIAPLHFNRHLDNVPRNIVWGWRAPRIPKTSRIINSFGNGIAHFAMDYYCPDIVHETYYSSEAYSPRSARRIITVYDMINEKFPSIFFRSNSMTSLKRQSVDRADKVICISESTKRDLIEFIGIPEEKISVIYLGFDRLAVEKDKNCDRRLIVPESPYLLYVGSRSEYKNFKTLVAAYASSPVLRDNYSLVCFGGGYFNKEERACIDKVGLSGHQRVVNVQGGDAVLSQMYQGAAAFIYPSLYEGFGIPPLEAMSLGCPVICSNTSSIPEVVGDAGEYFNPNNVESMVSAIESVIQSSSLRENLIRKGRERCIAFSWEKCAHETLQIYRSLM